MNRRDLIRLSVLILTSLLISGCGRLGTLLATPTPYPTYTPLPTLTPYPTYTPVRVVTSTPMPPTATFTPILPTVTPTRVLPTATPSRVLPTTTPTSEKWLLEGCLFTNFTSLCDVGEPEPLSIKEYTVAAQIEYSVTGCVTMDERLQSTQLLVIVVRIQNLTNETNTLTLPWPSDVIVHTKTDSKPALAYRYPFGGGWGRWVTVGKGKLTVQVKPSAAVELACLLSRFSGEVTIEVVNTGSFRISAPSEP